jgi:hypothetical protein
MPRDHLSPFTPFSTVVFRAAKAWEEAGFSRLSMSVQCSMCVTLWPGSGFYSGAKVSSNRKT